MQGMKRSDYEERQKGIARTEWFKNHKAELTNFIEGGRRVQMIDWRQPDTSNYYVRYILSGRFLIVIGDILDAVFEWGENVTLGFLAGCDLHYFTEKCRASENGSRFTHWHPNVAIYHCIEMLHQWGAGVDTLAAVEEAITSSKDEFQMFLHAQWQNPRTADPFIRGLDGEQMSALLESGDVIHPRCIGMWVGLKMANEQLHQ